MERGVAKAEAVVPADADPLAHHQREPGGVERLLAEAPRQPALDVHHRECHLHRPFRSARDGDLAAEPQRRSARGLEIEHELPRHLAAVEVPQVGRELDPPHVARLDVGAEVSGLQHHGPRVFQLYRRPEADRDPPAILIGQAEPGRAGVGPAVPVVEDAHHVALAGEVPLDRRLAADHEQVPVAQVGRDVEAERGEVPVVRAQKAAVEPHVGTEERTAHAQDDAAVDVRAREDGAIPDRGPVLLRPLLLGDRDGCPPFATALGEALRLALAERQPGGLPVDEPACPSGSRTWRQLKTVVHQAASPRAYGPEALSQRRTVRSGKATASASVAPSSTRATTLPPNPPPI